MKNNNQKESMKQVLSNQKNFFILELSAMSLIYLVSLYVIISKLVKEEPTALITTILLAVVIFITGIFLKDFEDGIKKILSLYNNKEEN